MFDSWRDLEGTIFGQNQIFPGFFDGHLPQSCLAFFVKKRTAEHRVFSQRVAHIFTITSDSSISRNKNKNKRQKYI
jgi:hypothetical protein